MIPSRLGEFGEYKEGSGVAETERKMLSDEELAKIDAMTIVSRNLQEKLREEAIEISVKTPVGRYGRCLSR